MTDVGYIVAAYGVVLGGTLLYAITGELDPAEGSVHVLDEPLPRPSVRELFALRRRMGVLLQGNGLLTDLTVFENVALPVRMHRPMPEAALRDLVVGKLAAVGLGEAGELMPQQLSGGMARRVALARALVLGPPLMLYDEPLTGLDPIACGVILDLIHELDHRRTGVVSCVPLEAIEDLARDDLGSRASDEPVIQEQRGTRVAETADASFCLPERSLELLPLPLVDVFHVRAGFQKPLEDVVLDQIRRGQLSPASIQRLKDLLRVLVDR